MHFSPVSEEILIPPPPEFEAECATAGAVLYEGGGWLPLDLPVDPSPRRSGSSSSLSVDAPPFVPKSLRAPVPPPPPSASMAKPAAQGPPLARRHRSTAKPCRKVSLYVPPCHREIRPGVKPSDAPPAEIPAKPQQGKKVCATRTGALAEGSRVLCVPREQPRAKPYSRGRKQQGGAG